MTFAIDKKEKKAILEKILRSETFAHSHSHQDLLRYLVNASIDNITPKEYTIATEVLHRGPDFDSRHDTIVRVYAYNLRKKLDHYYSHEGKDDRVRIDIPKGHYEIVYLLRDEPEKKERQVKYLQLALIVLLCLSNIYLIYHYFSFSNSGDGAVQTDLRDDPIWGSFLSNGVAKQIVLGDHFFFIKDSNIREKRTILRKDDINTLSDFTEYKARDRERFDLVKLRYPMFPRNSVWPISDIISLFNSAQQSYKLNYASNVRATDFKNDDLIFIGSFHTLASFEQTFHNSRIEYQVYPNKLTYYDETGDSLVTLGEEGDPVYNHIDYGVARKIPAPGQKTIFIFASFHETGTIGIVKYFTDPASRQELSDLCRTKYGRVPQYYETVFRASGYNRTVYTTEILHISQVNADAKFW